MVHFVLKMPSFYQNRLGTNIGKALKREMMRVLNKKGELADMAFAAVCDKRFSSRHVFARHFLRIGMRIRMRDDQS